MDNAASERAVYLPLDASRQEATIEKLLGLLRSMYWDSVEREICNMILAYSEINKVHPQPIELETYSSESISLSSKNYETIFRLWSPILASGDVYKKVESLHRIAQDSARERLTMDFKYRRARSLLQSSSLLDVDLVHDHTDPYIIRQPQHRPRSELVTDTGNQSKLYRAIRCRSCFSNIRAHFYYECQKGCKDNLSPDFPSQLCRKEHDSVSNVTTFAENSLAPVRLCPPCVVNSARYFPCERAHLRTRYVGTTESKGEKAFRNRLHKSESKPHKKAVNPAIRVLGKIIAPGHLVPAGPLHVAVMFGPLLLEIGVPNTSGGVLITSRQLPSLCFQSSNALLYSESDRQSEKPETQEVVLFQDGQQRYLRMSSQAQRDRLLLASVKRVYGGAFSGRDARLQQKEEAVVLSLITASESFRYLASKSMRANYNRLHIEAAKVTSLVREIIDHDVNAYLEHFSSVLLDHETLLRWDARLNTCQDFVDKLLRSTRFVGLIPKLPREFVIDENVRANPKYDGLRYLISFGTNIDTPIAMLRPQPRSVVWRFYHEIRDNCDLIEYAQRTTHKQASIPPHLRRVSVLQYPQSTADVSVDDLVDALWELPRDTLSMLQTHLLRQREKYSSLQGLALTQREWVIDRLQFVQQLDMFGSLAGAWGSAWLAEFLRKPEGLLLKGFWPDSATFGNMHVSENVQMIGRAWWYIYFVTGREREWWKRETYYSVFKTKRRLLTSGIFGPSESK